MKRWIGSLVLVGVASAAIAQGPFTIVRPADGSRVREKVRILIPKGSIPSGAYVGVFLNGSFLEAVVPPLNGKFHEYVLDTKGRGMPDTSPDTTDKLELVLYAGGDDDTPARILDRSSVDIRVANYSAIPVPSQGLNLRYKFVPGAEMVYKLEQKISTSQLNENQNNPGVRAATFDTEGETIRMRYAVVNSYGNGDGLIRMQALPMKGKDYADLTAGSDTEPKRYYDTEMAPLIMRISSTGHEVFGSMPSYVPMEGTNGMANLNSLFAAFPLPTLPTKPVRPADSWQSRIQQGALDMENSFNVDSIVARTPARGEFVRLEWERGRPCAVLRNVLEAGTKSPDKEKLAKAGVMFDGDKVSMTETIWFALDTRQVLKTVREVTIDRKNEGGLGGGAFGAPGGAPGGRGPGMAAGAGAGGGKPGLGGSGFSNTGINRQKGGGAPGAGPGGLQGPGGPPAGFGAPGGFGRPGGGGAAQGGSAVFTRIKIQQTFTLEN